MPGRRGISGTVDNVGCPQTLRSFTHATRGSMTQKLCHPLCVFDVPIDPQRDRFDTLQKKKGIERSSAAPVQSANRHCGNGQCMRHALKWSA